MRGKVAAAIAALIVTGCGAPEKTMYSPEEATPTTTASSGPLSAPPSATAAPPPATPTEPPAACNEAPIVIVDMINAAFTNGQHLEHAAAIDGPQASTYVIGDITRADGQRENSSEAWVFREGVVYALTRNARRDTLFTDGRDLVPADFFSTDLGVLSQCIAAARRTAGS